MEAEVERLKKALRDIAGKASIIDTSRIAKEALGLDPRKALTAAAS